MPTVSADRTVVSALATDLLCVILFCTIGRRSHAEGLNIAGIAETAWPFLTGTLVGWFASTAWRRPYALLPTGVAVWLATVVVGMLLRKLTSAGTATSFIVVASISTAVLLLGWRGVLRLMTRG
jgi:hypothetical protein